MAGTTTIKEGQQKKHRKFIYMAWKPSNVKSCRPNLGFLFLCLESLTHGTYIEMH